MTLRTRKGFTRIYVAVTAILPAAMAAGGCTNPRRLTMQAHRYRVEVRMDPGSHRLVGRAVLDLSRTGPEQGDPGSHPTFVFLLHPDLDVTRIAISGTEGRYLGAPLSTDTTGSATDNGFAPRKHLVAVREPVEAFTLFVDYEGRLRQDVAAGEAPGKIHNFTMRAHIGQEGIYLADAYWYPQPFTEKGAKPRLADFELLADPVPGFELVAGAERDAALSERTGRVAWRSPYPLESMVLVGGPHEVHHANHNGVAIHLHLKPSQAKHAVGLVEAVRRNLDRYEPLIGPYPAAEFSIVDNFFSSGFAFPTFTLLSSAVIEMGKRSQTAHGYLDHEMLHCWWGNGVYVDPRDGNWCEALASYGANYYGHVLDGDEAEARRKRRNYSQFLSRLDAELNKPLGTYGQEGGCGRRIAYQKGAMVFHMLARKIGQENFWSAMRRLTAEYVGSYASWEDIRRVCEQVSGTALEDFFRQWVRNGGAPRLSIESAEYDSDDHALTMVITQQEPVFVLEVPVRITHAGGTLDVEIPVRNAREEVTVPLEVIPLSVELDPDYHLFRRVPLDRIIPTTASTRKGPAFLCVLPGGKVPQPYTSVQAVFERDFQADKRIARTVGNIEAGALAERCVLILGEAVHDPYVDGFLSAIEFPVRFTDAGFTFEGQAYTDADYALLCTVSHPDVIGGGVTVVYGNSESAIPRARLVPMYDRSLVIFKNHRPILRRDFERRHIIRVDG